MILGPAEILVDVDPLSPARIGPSDDKFETFLLK
tara:strand:+ start:599 stop:700 length:102 start_codon:yes stop_codon:yes gene_type:complete